MTSIAIHRPRNVDAKRGAALLYGDWGTSKAYVIGLAFVAAGYSAFPVILAVSVLTGIVGYNYIIICKHFPDGGGVYSAARDQSRLLAVTGALLLVANFTVTAAMSGWAAMTYFGVPREFTRWATIGVILLVGGLNYFGPKHSGSLAMFLALPMVLVVIAIIALSASSLNTTYLEPSTASLSLRWVTFTNVILALSGVEAIANLTGVMKLDPGSTVERPRVTRTAAKSILPVALEVVAGTVLLGWAMLSIPSVYAPELNRRWEDMLRYLAEYYGTAAFGLNFGTVFGLIVGGIVGLLLLSAVNTAVGALIGLNYMMARDGEMPRAFSRLNPFGVPWLPLLLATGLPIATALVARDLQSLAGLYAIGVVGAITVNLGSCTFNKTLPLAWYERAFMGLTFFILLAVELTIAKTKGDALFFAICVVGSGLALRSYALRRAGFRTLTVSHQVAAAVAPETMPTFRMNLEPGQAILVAARGPTPVLRFALEEARLRQGRLYVLYVKELAVTLPGPLQTHEGPKWQDDPAAATIMYSMLDQGQKNEVSVIPLYTISDNPAGSILDLSATLGIDILMLGSPQRSRLVHLLKGNVVTEVAHHLPENIQLVIYG